MNYIYFLVGAYLALANSRLGNINVNESEWESFKLEHRKEYVNTNEESMRKMIFAYNKHQVDEFNAKQSSEAGFELGLNHLGDVSEMELKSLNGIRLPENHEVRLKNSDHANKFLEAIFNDDSEVPESVDWRKTPGVVSQVKNQGTCGSCWAFASTGVLEGQEGRRANKTNFGASDLVELSEQNLVDCVTADAGCDGGIMADALDFVKVEGGIDDEKSYPYEGRTRKCRFNKNKVAFTDQGSAILPEGDEQKLKEVVAKFGPVAVAIDASSMWFQLYHGGVYYNKHCHNKKDQLDHGVLVVGYGTDPKKGDYWIVKNSWGPKYGEAGYIRMARNRKNHCGIATMATIPTF